ncbi:MAG TPA: acetyl-CoA decarbonylase/synthase complex subunit gamma [Syntrophorhabdaceae bacterium]|nr:acetyl-CoA decarbonylase/synthase complex subunit gamma [Syntrophorhabdaceae bacterium]
MGLTGIQIFKLLPKTNCGQCKYPTCLAFAMALAAAKAELDACPHVSEESRAELSDASAPPIRQLSIGTGEYELKIGGETVMFRHEKTFFNKPGFAVLITDAMSDAETERRFSALSDFTYERVGVAMKAEMAALKHTGSNDRFLELVKRACSKPYSFILMTSDEVVLKSAVELSKSRKPLIYAATEDNVELFGNIAKGNGLPIVAKGDGIDKTAAVVEKLLSMGIKDVVLDTSTRGIKDGFQEQIAIRRAALVSKNKLLGFPTITFPAEMTENKMKEALIASLFVAKYAGIIVLSDLAGETVFPLMLQRLNIYTDPQRPMTTKQGIYPINNPDVSSPVLVTANFSLTYFVVSSEIENSRVPAWLCVMDTEGLSVMTAWAAGKFLGDQVGDFIKKSGVMEKVSHKKLIIPGYSAAILGELEEELPGWQIIIGPREAAHIPALLKNWKKESI